MVSRHKIKSVVVAAAVMDELAVIQTKVSNIVPVKSPFSMIFHQGVIGDIHITLIATGPGMVNTAAGLSVCFERCKPDLLIQTGCAGAFKQAGVQMGDIAVATSDRDMHLGIENQERESAPPSPLPFPVIKTDNLSVYHTYPTSTSFSDFAYSCLTNIRFSLHHKVKKGPFITVSTITATHNRAHVLFSETAAAMESMEGAAAAHCALLFNIPYIQIRSASNYVGHRDRDSWDLKTAFQHSGKAVCHLIDHLNHV